MQPNEPKVMQEESYLLLCWAVHGERERAFAAVSCALLSSCLGHLHIWVFQFSTALKPSSNHAVVGRGDLSVGIPQPSAPPHEPQPQSSPLERKNNTLFDLRNQEEPKKSLFRTRPMLYPVLFSLSQIFFLILVHILSLCPSVVFSFLLQDVELPDSESDQHLQDLFVTSSKPS